MRFPLTSKKAGAGLSGGSPSPPAVSSARPSSQLDYPSAAGRAALSLEALLERLGSKHRAGSPPPDLPADEEEDEPFDPDPDEPDDFPDDCPD